MNYEEQANRFTPLATERAQNPPHLLGDETDIRNIDGHTFPKPSLQLSDDELRILQKNGIWQLRRGLKINVTHKCAIGGRFTIRFGRDDNRPSIQHVAINGDEKIFNNQELYVFSYRGYDQQTAQALGLQAAENLAALWNAKMIDLAVKQEVL